MGKFMCVNNNPKNKKTSDCVIRALVTALDKDIVTIISDLTNIYMTKGWFLNDPKCYDTYLRQNNYIKCPMPKKYDNTKFTAEEFCTYLNNRNDVTGVVLAHVGGHHISTFVNIGTEEDKDYRIQDIWDCSNKCVGNWWKLL